MKKIPKKINVDLPLTNILCYCLTCGKNLGNVVYVKELTVWNHLDYIPVCRKCFDDHGLELVSPDKMEGPFNVNS